MAKKKFSKKPKYFKHKSHSNATAIQAWQLDKNEFTTSQMAKLLGVGFDTFFKAVEKLNVSPITEGVSNEGKPYKIWKGDDLFKLGNYLKFDRSKIKPLSNIQTPEIFYQQDEKLTISKNYET